MCTAFCAYAADLTFDVEVNDNDGFTVTPSDNVQEYATGVFPQFLVEIFATKNMTVGDYMAMLAEYGLFFGHTNTGVSYHTLEEYAEEGDEITDGLYIIAIMGVKADGSRHIVTTPVYQFDWLIDHTKTGIRDVEVAASSAKMFKDGKFIFNSRFLLNGTLIQ